MTRIFPPTRPRMKLTLDVERKPDPPGFLCSLCEESREYWQLSWSGDGCWICSLCPLSGKRTPHYWNSGLSWLDQNTINIAHLVLGTLRIEIDRERKTELAGRAA